jgi:hypothetical protein
LPGARKPPARRRRLLSASIRAVYVEVGFRLIE